MVFHDADLTSTYQYERRALKLLQWGTPVKPWRLKSPTHLLFLDYLDRAFPDARFVMTHRDPAEVIVSVADLYAELGRHFSDDLDLHYLGALNVEQWSVGMERTLAFRDAGADGRFYDIDFRAMQQDPIGEVCGLYAWLGEPVTGAFASGMKRWWHDNAERREKNVHPDPSGFGIDLSASGRCSPITPHVRGVGPSVDDQRDICGSLPLPSPAGAETTLRSRSVGTPDHPGHRHRVRTLRHPRQRYLSRGNALHQLHGPRRDRGSVGAGDAAGRAGGHLPPPRSPDHRRGLRGGRSVPRIGRGA